MDLPKGLRKKDILILANDFKVREALKGVRKYMVSQSLLFSCPCFVVLFCLCVLENEVEWHVWDMEGHTRLPQDRCMDSSALNDKMQRFVLKRCC